MYDTKNVIIHGDSRDYIPRIKTPINLVVTDPPYGMDFVSNRAVTPDGKKLNRRIEGDLDPEAAVDLFASVMEPVLSKLSPEADVYVFTAWHVLDLWIPAVKALPGLELKMMLLWEKGYPGQGDLVANWGCGHEVCLYLKKGRRPIPKRRSGILHVTGDLDAEIAYQEWYLQHLKDIRDAKHTPGPLDTGFIAVDKIPAGQNVHPTEKPVQLLEQLIEMSSDRGDLVVDPFSGSGSTSVAAQRLGRNSLAFDIDETYARVGNERLKQVGFAL